MNGYVILGIATLVVVVIMLIGMGYQVYRIVRPLSITPYRCEVCGSSEVVRSGKWDHCAHGHIYVGERA